MRSVSHGDMQEAEQNTGETMTPEQRQAALEWFNKQFDGHHMCPHTGNPICCSAIATIREALTALDSNPAGEIIYDPNHPYNKPMEDAANREAAGKGEVAIPVQQSSNFATSSTTPALNAGDDKSCVGCSDKGRELFCLECARATTKTTPAPDEIVIKRVELEKAVKAGKMLLKEMGGHDQQVQDFIVSLTYEELRQVKNGLSILEIALGEKK